MKSKKTLALALAALILAVTLAACGEEAPHRITSGSEPASSSGTPVKTEPKTEKTAETEITAETKAPVETKETQETKETKETATKETKEAETKEKETAEKTTQEPEPPTESAVRDAIAALAKEKIGTEFVLGGTGPDTFDNSGFVYYCCKANGVQIPRLAADIANAGTTVTREEMVPGDIAVFRNEIDGPPAFVGIYVGDGKFIACNNPERPTCLQNMDVSYWQERFVSGRRVA